LGLRLPPFAPASWIDGQSLPWGECITPASEGREFHPHRRPSYQRPCTARSPLPIPDPRAISGKRVAPALTALDPLIIWTRGYAKRFTPGFTCSRTFGASLNGAFHPTPRDTSFGAGSWWTLLTFSAALIEAVPSHPSAHAENIVVNLIHKHTINWH
jgi:hypothetical protein